MNRWGSALVRFADFTRPQDLVGAMALDAVYTPAERVRSGAGRTLQHWAGRLAGKYAVLRLLDLPPTAELLGSVEVLPRPTPVCEQSAACLDGHPPAVQLSGELTARARSGERIRISLSHTDGHALAVAVAAARLPEDD
ncbi:phosphopantetheinyl transferase [Nonomuraea endophytica]|uniref:Phosphopantetheinyl transferase (Holo-ACP synthase) n=1 Tax=Nonomuraea endophytica TaxID=714136 RepID=A0A7W8AAV9_9ACTN|nr:phosphopantetheinyl transferase [Nonomuraea endophytica]MBB5082732.1 phosphopantetheinyl transferase (holo-ACP synthase) [Nonomuraea endophytica]